MVRVASAPAVAYGAAGGRRAGLRARPVLRKAAPARQAQRSQRSFGCDLGSPARCAKARCRLRVRAAVGTPGRARQQGTDKSRLRTILRAVHPDRFSADPRARELNTASLQKLNAYCDALSSGGGLRCVATSLRFVVHADGDSAALREVEAALPPGGCLQPLFAAFAMPRSSGARRRRNSGARDDELLAWLSSHLDESKVRRGAYATRSAGLAAAKAAVEAEFGLRNLHLGYTAESASAEPVHLSALAEALRCFSEEQTAAFADVTIVLADSQEMPRSTASRGASADGAFLLADDGKLWLSLVTDWRPLWRFLRDTDLAWAAAAGAASRARAAAVDAALPGLAELLRVQYIHAPTTLQPEPLASFCAALADASSVLAAAPPAQPFRFGVSLCADVAAGAWDVVWADSAGRTLVAYAFGQRSVQVDARCSPFALAQFLTQHGPRCDAECAAGASARAGLERVQASLLSSLGVTLSSSALLNDQLALAAAERLLAAAPELRAKVGVLLAGSRLMIVADTDACRYQVLPAGTLCIPASFKLEEVLRAVLSQHRTAACAR